MARKPRFSLPGIPQHVIQRGNNREPCFYAEDDYHRYLGDLKEALAYNGCRLHAYVLMTNHVHLLLTPMAEHGVSHVMQDVGRKYVRYINHTYRRSGTLWEGRYKSSPIKQDEYLLACCRYVELNPIRAGIVDAPENYKWSSYRCKIGIEKPDWLDLDPCYKNLGNTDKERAKRYKQFVKGSIPDGEWALIREALQRGQLTGSNRFIEEVERKIGRRIECRGQGRPRKSGK